MINATDDSKYDERSDTYSFGICCWEIATRQFPFDEYSTDPRFLTGDGREINTLKIKTAIAEKSLRPSFLGPEEGCPGEFEKLIKQCWHTDPNLRPSFDYIVKKLYAISGLPMPEIVAEELHDVSTTFSPSFSSKSGSGAARRSSVVLSNPHGGTLKAGKSNWAKTSDLTKLGMAAEELANMKPAPLEPSKSMGVTKSLPAIPQAAPASSPFASATTKPLPKPPLSSGYRAYASNTAPKPSTAVEPAMSLTEAVMAPPPSYDEATRDPRSEPSLLGDAVGIVSANASNAVAHVSTKFKSKTSRLFRRKTEK